MQRLKMIGRRETQQWILSTMTRRSWKNIYPTNLRQAAELCVQYALDKHNKSVERIAEDMGISSHWTLYKWLESGRMPLLNIRPFEIACGINFITKYIAHSANYLAIDIPTGRKSEHRELSELNLFMSQAVQNLYEYQDGKKSADDVVGVITSLMEDLAHQRGNLVKEKQPELDFTETQKGASS